MPAAVLRRYYLRTRIEQAAGSPDSPAGSPDTRHRPFPGPAVSIVAPAQVRPWSPGLAASAGTPPAAPPSPQPPATTAPAAGRRTATARLSVFVDRPAILHALRAALPPRP